MAPPPIGDDGHRQGTIAGILAYGGQNMKKRERYTQKIAVRVTPELWAKIAHAAVVSGCTASEVIRHWCEQGPER
jgi:hypothetical protein